MLVITNAQDIGKRKKQEDYFASRAFKDGYVCIVADGIGGQSGGDKASRTSVKAFLNYLKNHHEIGDIKALFLKALLYANDAIKQQIQQNPSCENMGTTFTALFVSEEKAFWISVGDSIIYHLRDDKLARLNEEHLAVGEINKQLLSGKISQKEFDTYPNRHSITSCLSSDKIEQIDISSKFFKVKDGDIFLVSSDGLHTVPVETLKHICKHEKSTQLAKRLVEKVKKIDKKNQDNTSLIAIKIEGKTVAEKTPKPGILDRFKK